MELNEIVKRAKEAAQKLAILTTKEKNDVLLGMAEKIEQNRQEIVNSNKKDVDTAINLDKHMIDRLTLNYARIDSMIAALRAIVQSKDYVGEIVSDRQLKNGLHIIEKRFGIGVILVIFEARPNVITDVIGLCIKSSCSVILKGGQESFNTLQTIFQLLKGVCPINNSFQLITDRDIVKQLLRMDLDLVIPRGSQKLINFVKSNTHIPVLAAGKGNCHIYVDKSANQVMAINIIINAKTQRPSVCNAVEKVLIHNKISQEFLPKLNEALMRVGIEIRGCVRTKKIIKCKQATEQDWSTEYLDLIIAIKIVDSLDEAIDHINKYSSKHSEAIIASNKENQIKFLNKIDSACVYVNASTRFTDGYEFGLGAEIGNSTQKLHARGPLGLKALTTTKYLIIGEGQIRE